MTRAAPIAAGILIALVVAGADAAEADYIEPPMLAEKVAAGQLPPVASRLPETPAVARLDAPDKMIGRHGGSLRLLMSRTKDVRMMVVYGYARLVTYDGNFDLVADILDKVVITDGRVFTLHLPNTHRSSDDHPFTSEDFRYYWEDVATNDELSPAGLPKELLVDGQPPVFEVLNATTVRYTWPRPNPFFLPALARASPLYIYRPAHYLSQFHKRYMDAKELARLVEESGQQNWMGLQFRKGRQYRNNNPKLPTLQPWVLRTKPPSNRFIFERNPYYHRVDTNGRQLPYIDRVLMTIASAKLIPAKVGAGEADLQARSLAFNNFTFLKRAEKRNNYDVRLWRSAKGSQMTLYPNLNVEDPVWRKLMRSVEFRRALSISINRHEVNQVIFFGLATAANNTVLTESQLYLPEYGTEWAQFDVAAANRLLDGLGLDKRDARGIRLLPDGRTMEITVETAGEDTEQADVLELIRDSWRQVGIKLHTRLQQREVFRNRVFAGQTLVSVWFGLENGVPNADTPPSELAPTSQQQLQWPKWGQHYETNGHAGEAPGLPKAKELMDLYGQWVMTADPDGRLAIWHRMLTIHADQVFTIGLVRGVPQPVVVDRALRNVPAEGIYNWDPGAHFGIHKPDTFWFADENRRS
jgi:peptide/nickel transport system substrate-binding protein